MRVAFIGVCSDIVYNRIMLDGIQNRNMDLSSIITRPNGLPNLSVIINRDINRQTLWPSNRPSRWRYVAGATNYTMQNNASNLVSQSDGAIILWFYQRDLTLFTLPEITSQFPNNNKKVGSGDSNTKLKKTQIAFYLKNTFLLFFGIGANLKQ